MPILCVQFPADHRLRRLRTNEPGWIVFWSLLAIPTLTILISNMDDTVVKWVKEPTIWFGEATVLPSNGATVPDRPNNGVLATIFGKYQAKQKRQAGTKAKQIGLEEAVSGGNADQPPGRMLGLRELRKRTKTDRSVNARPVDNFAQCKAEDGEEGNCWGGGAAADEHQLRCQLLQEIRKVYHDVSSLEGKQYTYHEWVYYTKLLGQDEGNSKYHIQPNEATMHPDLIATLITLASMVRTKIWEARRARGSRDEKTHIPITVEDH